jgi:ABC-type antimicrobial peptide transport system permease subunit
LLRAVGFRRLNLAAMVLAENSLLLVLGLLSGVACALLAIAPTLSARGMALPVGSLGVMLAAVFVTGLAASLLAVGAVARAPLLPLLREE